MRDLPKVKLLRQHVNIGLAFSRKIDQFGLRKKLFQK